jgi:apolipoprotein N-acyltransferase
VNTHRPVVPLWLRLTGIVASGVLLGLYFRGGMAWVLGLVALVPWLLALNAERSLGAVLRSAWLMSIAFSAAVMFWFGAAFGAYVGIGTGWGVLILLLLSPLLQAQFLVFALVRHMVGLRYGLLLRAIAGALAWVASEWLFPKLLGGTLGHGLQPSAILRQVADLGGAAGLTFLLILVAEALACAIGRWQEGVCRIAVPLSLAGIVVLAMTGYGWLRLTDLSTVLAEPAPTLRVGLIQANLTNYEQRRQDVGAYAVVRESLDTHFELSRSAVELHGAEALLWSETVYPTTFGQPRSEDGAELDAEILSFVDELGVPLIFGTYDRDQDGEYNSAAVVDAGQGLLGHYHKTHPFPLTEYVPSWLDGPIFRGLFPWAGSWTPGYGARVFPLRTKDGREVSVLPLICLDDMRSALAIDGARLGAQAILGMSNDSWFTEYPLGARLHLSVASFRSIETRLPQLRVTTNGLSAVVDETGEVLVSTAMGDQAVLAAEVPARTPQPTLMLLWGDWVGLAGLIFLVWLAALTLWQRLAARFAPNGRRYGELRPDEPVLALEPAWRIVFTVLRLCAAGGLVWLALDMVLHMGLQVNSIVQVRVFLFAVVLPSVAAWFIQRRHAGSLWIEAGHLVLDLAHQRIEVPLQQIIAIEPWRLPLPHSGVHLRLASGARLSPSIAIDDPLALQGALAEKGSPAILADGLPTRLAKLAALRAAAPRRWCDSGWFKFGLFPLLIATPAFRLHQMIAFGNSFGELYTYGATAWLTGLGIWWSAWAIGLMLFASVLRVLIEVASLTASTVCRSFARDLRQRLETGARLVYFIGVPVFLLVRILGE